MTIYKLVVMDAPIWGLGERLEDCLIAVPALHILSNCAPLDLNLAERVSILQKLRADAPYRAGGEGAVSGVPPAVLRVDRRVVRHDHGADPGDGEAHGPTPQKGQHIGFYCLYLCSYVLVTN